MTDACRVTALLVVAATFCSQMPGGVAGQRRVAATRPPSIRSLRANAATIPRFSKFELTVELDAEFDNPYNPDEVDLQAEFTAPSGRKLHAIGFYYQDETLRGVEDETAQPLVAESGSPCWKIRFTPVEEGVHSYRLVLRNGSRSATWGPGEFQCVTSKRRGFIRVADNARYFQFDDGAPFFVVGQNLQNDWPRYRHSRLLADAGCNAVRAWVFCHWTWLEWSPAKSMSWAGPGHWMRSYQGAGRYNQRIAWVVDHHLQQWERDGLHVMFCLGNGSELARPDRYDYWGGHPYNRANGGFLDRGAEFWSSPQARKLYRQRLRYIVARYGYSTSVWAWELWNELGMESDETVAWHDEMSRYLKSIDPHRHLVTTSFWGNNAEINRRTWSLPAIDFTQTHNYAGAATIHQRTQSMLALSPKPHIIGEGGGPNPGPKRTADPDGIDFHNSLWSAAMSGAAGGTLPWWWRERIEPRNLFHHYTVFARLTRIVGWNSKPWRPLSDSDVRIRAPVAGSAFRPVVIVPQGPGWGARPPRDTFQLLPDGAITHVDQLSPVLFGRGRSQWRNPPTITLEMPHDGRFIARISETSHAILEIEVDGHVLARDDSLDQPRQPVGRDVAVELTPGSHRVILRNIGSDWVRLAWLAVTNCRDARRFPDIDVFGLAADDARLLWFHHRLNEWTYHELECPPQLVENATAELPGLTPGLYRVEWWDTYTGDHHVERRQVTDRLRLRLPPIATDVACRAMPAEAG